jgi:adenylate cyclase
MDEARFQRKLSAVLYADVAGYSRLIGLDEEGTQRVVGRYLDAITALIDGHQGHVGHYAGDAVLADFLSLVDAVSCARAIQQELGARNEGLPEDRRVEFRIGINIGDVLIDRNEVHGDDVNIAARVCDVADPGGICISGIAHDAIGSKLPLAYEFMGERTLKNIARPIRLYRVMSNGRSAAAALSTPLRYDAPLGPSIVVLPFDNLSTEPGQEYFCDGLTQDITTDLSKFSELLVIDSHSAFVYKGKQVHAKDLGTQLGVRYVLEGSVQKIGQKVRINAQLIDTSRGHHIWAERFQRDFEDVLALQDEIIQTIVGSLALKVDAAERERAMRERTPSINAYDAYLRGKHRWWSYLQSGGARDALDESRKYFELAAHLEPDYARAWAWLTYTYVDGWLEGWSEEDALACAERCATKALELEPSDYVCHWALAYFYLHTGQIGDALSEYETALSFNHNEANMLAEMSEALCNAGRHHEGLEWVSRAMRINPRFPGWYQTNLALLQYCLRDYDGVIAGLKRIARLRSDDRALLAAAHARKAELLAERGQVDAAASERQRAAEAMERFLEEKPGWTLGKERTLVHFQNREDLEHWLKGLEMADLPAGDDSRGGEP